MRDLKPRFCPLLLLSMFSFCMLTAQRLATLKVKLPPDGSGLAIPVHVSLDAITMLPDSMLQLTELSGKKRAVVNHQIDNDGERSLHWIIEPGPGNATLVFELIKQAPVQKENAIKTVNADGFLTISSHNKNLLRYNYKTMYPPPGVDTVFKRSAFIHPLWSPRGQELTRINAPDHYHHWGLWNPWTEVLFEKDTVDFWNLAKKQGTVRFAGFLSTTAGGVFAGYSALHEHIVFKKNGEEKTAISEVQSVRVYAPQKGQDYYIAEITIDLNCGGENPVLLLEYRYGGLGLRATAEWNKDNCSTITSEGKNRTEADGSTARWCMVQGAVNRDSAGLVIMGYPTNYNYPEPLRVWPENTNDRGDVFLNFSPTKNKTWELLPGKVYKLKYRLLVFNDTFTKEKAEAAWQHFAAPPEIKVTIDRL